MKSKLFILFAVLSIFVISCGSENSKECKNNSDCPLGQECTYDGVCITTGSTANDSENGGNGSSGIQDPDNPSENSSENSSENDKNDTDTTDTDTDTNAVTTDNDEASEEISDSGSETDKDTTGNEKDDSDEGDTTTETNDSQPDDEHGGESNDEPNTEINDYDELEITADDDVEFCSTTCPNLILDDGCLRNADGSPKDIDEGLEKLCNGVDDDCDGDVDEGCPCSAGETQPCFNGKPNQRNVGTCADGVQSCQVVMRGGAVAGKWGKCKDAILPKKDLCDKADNNCNGCADEGLCCSPKIDCSYDIGTAKPFVDKLIDGKKIYDPGNEYQDADNVMWEWTLTKGPCDIVLNKTSFTTKGATTPEGLSGDGAASTVVSGKGLSQFKVNFQLSGTYILHLKITREGDADPYECEWPLKVESDGLRVELCWDTNDKIDIDLHLGKNGATADWDDGTSSCYYYDCKGDINYGNEDDNSEYNWDRFIDWGYPETMNYNKNGIWTNLKNPRLDLDNIADGAIPENINLDNPKDGDTFRVLVRYFQGYCSSAWNCFWGNYNYYTTHPVVNIYCGGSLKATYGTAETSTQVSGFDDKNDSWKVTEIKWVGDKTSDACELTPNLNVINGSVPDYSNW